MINEVQQQQDKMLVMTSLQELLSVMTPLLKQAVHDELAQFIAANEEDCGTWRPIERSELVAMLGKSMPTISRGIVNGDYGDAIKRIGNNLYLNEKLLWQRV